MRNRTTPRRARRRTKELVGGPHALSREGEPDETIAQLDPSAGPDRHTPSLGRSEQGPADPEPQSLRASSCSLWLRAASNSEQARPSRRAAPIAVSGATEVSVGAVGCVK